eukprot:2694449-Alexandrium_andersonii.AAC.1
MTFVSVGTSANGVRSATVNLPPPYAAADSADLEFLSVAVHCDMPAKGPCCTSTRKSSRTCSML